MKHREDKPQNRESAPSRGSPQEKSKLPGFELPLDLDDILAVAVVDSILMGKRRKFGNRATARRK